MVQFNVNVQLLEPEVKVPDGSNYPDALVQNALLYSIAISLKKLRENQEFINSEIYQEIIRKLHG